MAYRPSPELLVLLAAIIWGTSGPATALAALPAGVISFFRMGVPTVVIGVWFLLRRHRLSSDGLRTRLFASLLNALRMLLYFAAYRFTTVANAVVALYTWPIFAAIWARIILGERVSLQRSLLLGLAFMGIPLLYLRALTAGPGTEGIQDLIGISSMILSAMLHALTIVLLKRARSGGSRFESTFYQNLLGAVIFLPVVLLYRGPVSVLQIGLALYLGLFVGLIGFTLFFVGLHGASTVRATTITYTEVVVAIIISTIFMGQPLYWNTIVGGVLIVVSVLISQRIGSTGEPSGQRRNTQSLELESSAE